MSKLAKRIIEMEKLKQDLLMEDDVHFSRKAYIQLLNLHIALLKEVYNLGMAISNGDTKEVQKWYDYRLNDLTERDS